MRYQAGMNSALRRKAAQRKQSLNQVVVDELTMATGGTQGDAALADRFCDKVWFPLIVLGGA